MSTNSRRCFVFLMSVLLGLTINQHFLVKDTQLFLQSMRKDEHVVTPPASVIEDRDNAQDNTDPSTVSTIEDDAQNDKENEGDGDSKQKEEDAKEQQLGSTDADGSSNNPVTSSETMAENVGTNFDGDSTEHRTKNIIAARLGLMEASPDIVEEMKEVNISIVVSYCDGNLVWIPEYVGKDYSIKDITIYNKCGDKKVRGVGYLKQLSPAVDVITLPNVGRCDHTYAYWIKEHYMSIFNDKMNENDIVLFLKDNNRNQRMFNPIDLLLSHVSTSGFGCVRKPICECNKLCVKGYHMPTMLHDRAYVFNKFTIGTYQRLERDKDDAFRSEKYTFLGEWKKDMEMVIPESKTMPVCYGGLFAAQKKQVLNQPEETWDKMESSLSRADNIMESHFAERLWASILSDVDIDSAKAVDKSIVPHMKFMVDLNGPKRNAFCGMAGMLYYSKTD